jgi:hypothetical protein
VVIVLIAVLALVAHPTGARADSIYLKNGRVIRTDEARVEGERVVFWLHGGYQSLPLEIVDRVEDDDWGTPGRPLGPAADSSDAVAGAPATAPAAPADAAAALQALSGMMSGGAGGVDTAQALQLLQSLGGTQPGAADGGLGALAPLLGMLGGAGAEGAGALGGLASDLDKVQTVLPALSRLGAALFAPEYSADATEAAARDLIRSLEQLGVSRSEIRARAQQLGVPAEILDRIRND